MASAILPPLPMSIARRTTFVVAATACILGTLSSVLYVLHRARAHTPETILARADDLSWNNDWLAAYPLYQQAEQLFMKQGKASKALYAHVSQFIPRAESEPLPDLIYELGQDQKLPAAQDGDTKLRILVIRGMIETNYDAAMAEKTWSKVYEMAAQRGEFRLMFRAMGEKGVADFLRGDFTRAKKRVTKAWLAAKVFHDEAAHVRYASLYGTGLVGLLRYSESLHVLDEAIDTANNHPQIAYPTIALNSKIDALRGLHRYKEALDLADEVLRRLPPGRLDAHLFEILTSRGTVYSDTGDWRSAAIQFDKALEYARHLKYWRGISQTAGLLALAHEHENDLPSALLSIDEALDANAKLPHELYFAPRNLAIKAEILARMRRAKESHALFEKSMTLIDSFVATAPTPNMERQLVDELGEVYNGYYKVLCTEGDLGSGFRTIEKERGLVEAQALEHHEVVAPHSETEQERKITELNLELIRTNNPTTRERLTQALYQGELELDDSSLARSTVRNPMDVRSVQRHLQDDELLLEYVLNDTESSVLAITARSIVRYPLPPRKTITELVTRYRSTIAVHKSDPTTAEHLFTSLLGPVKEYRFHRSVIVVPDREINLVPFAALVDNGSYGVESHAFSSSPSATVLCLLREREAQALLVYYQYVGVAAWTERDNPKRRFGDFLRGISFPAMSELQQLPQTRNEVETIARELPAPSTLLLGPAATETSFKALHLNQYRILHLALHGYADMEFPDRSALVFAPQSHGPDDGLLEVREVRSLRLKAELVTLSACNTGVGPVGEVDVADLGHAFIEAGAETVVSALWELNDQATTHLMTCFYRNLTRHETKTVSLQQAQLDMLRSGLPPYYWASFEMIGDPSGAI